MSKQSICYAFILIIIAGSGTLLMPAFGNITLNGNIDFGTKQAIYHANYTKLTVNQIQVTGKGITVVPNLKEYPTQYNFSSNLLVGKQFDVQIQNITAYQTDFRILTAGLTDVNGTVNTAQIQSLKLDNVNSASTWKGQLRAFSVNSTKQVKEIFALIVNAFHSDGVTVVYGNTRQYNSTSSNNIFTLVSGIANIPGTYNLQNVTIWNSLINFVVDKRYNINTTSTQPMTRSTHDFDVDCPSDGTGADIEVFTNETDGHRIVPFTTPTCFANNTVNWSTTFIPNGNSAASYNTQTYVRVLNATFLNNATLKVNSTKYSVVLNSPYLISANVPVGTGFQTKLLRWSMNLTVASGFTPINFTVGHISVVGTNHVLQPIEFSTNPINSTTTAVTVSFPSFYTMGYDLTYTDENKKQTLRGLPTTTPFIGRSQSVITFKNPSNDTVSIKAYDITSHDNATYQLTQPNGQIPFVQQILNFKNGQFGTNAKIGTIDLITLIVLIIAMIGLNRVNETIGIVIMVMVIGGIAYFGIVAWPTVMTAAIALVFLVIVSSTKKLPWS